MNDIALAHCNTFWAGRELSPLAAACLHSFVELGHPVTLYAYEPIRNVPAGVILADAASVLPRARMRLHRVSQGSALFSDCFRYELLHLGRGLWIDCDLLCLKPLPPTRGYIFGWEKDGAMNNAILHIPTDAPLLDDLRSMFSTHWAPPWFSRSRRFRYKLKYLLWPGFGAHYMLMGTIGPDALTYYSRAHGVDVHAAPRAVYYPVPFDGIESLLEPGYDIARHLTDDSVCIHLWNSKLAPLIEAAPPSPTSFVGRVLDGTWRQALRG